MLDKASIFWLMSLSLEDDTFNMNFYQAESKFRFRSANYVVFQRTSCTLYNIDYYFFNFFLWVNKGDTFLMEVDLRFLVVDSLSPRPVRFCEVVLIVFRVFLERLNQQQIQCFFEGFFDFIFSTPSIAWNKCFMENLKSKTDNKNNLVFRPKCSFGRIGNFT